MKRSKDRGTRRLIGLILVAVLAAFTLASFPATASPLGCTAVGYDDCSFVSPGGTVKAIGAGSGFSVSIDGTSCINGVNGAAQKSCPAPLGSFVYVWARGGVTSSILLWT